MRAMQSRKLDVSSPEPLPVVKRKNSPLKIANEQVFIKNINP